MTEPKVRIPQHKIMEFCARWRITELALFGSVLRDDFGPDSDIDILVTFAPKARRTLFDLVDIRDELESIFGRKVDVFSRGGVESSRNPIRRKAVLESAEVIYAAS